SGNEGLSLQELLLLDSRYSLADHPVFLGRMRALVAQMSRHVAVIQNVDFRGADQLERGMLLDDIGHKPDFFDTLLNQRPDAALRHDAKHGVQTQEYRRS